MKQKDNQQIFSVITHNKHKEQVINDYKNFITDLRTDLEEGFDTDVVDQNFLDQLFDIFQDENLNFYSPLKFYWMNLVDNIIYLIQMHEELQNESNLDEDLLSETENELLEFWNESELSSSFLNSLNDGLSVIEASNALLPLLENQIIAFYILHISQTDQKFEDPIIYQTIPELGDSNIRFYIGDLHNEISLNSIPATFPALPINEISFEKKQILIEQKPQQILQIKETSNFIFIENQKIFILPQCENGIKNIVNFKENISKALNNIKISAPHLFNTFKSFTHTIIPVNEPGIVSYSMQSLPGYSSINLFERDSIDLMDDLLHENGHHYLNTILNYKELIIEDQDKIFYSPWRKALRPIRGIYHAYFTFYWALELFYNLNNATSNNLLKFNEDEVVKIKTRFLEELNMLEYVFVDLNQAFKLKKITKEGMDLINQIQEKILTLKPIEKSLIEELESKNLNLYNNILNLKNELQEKRKQFKF